MSLLWIVREQHLLLLFLTQVLISLVFIYHGKNKLSFASEIILSVACFLYHQPDLDYLTIGLYAAEYLILKFFLLLVVYCAKRFSFYVIYVITHKNKKKLMHKFLIKKKHFLRFQARIWNKVNYGIKVKKGIPSMADRKNSQTGIHFDSDGFPKFKAIVEIKLPRKYWKKDRQTHFYHASKLLYGRISKSARLAKKFSRKDIASFKRGELPSKYTWHHHQDKGLLQLVDADIHAKVRHNGGFSLWGKE